MEAEEPLQPSRRGARSVTLREGQRLRITGLSLADPAAVADGQPVVRVWADEVGRDEQRVIGTLSSSEEERIKRVLPPLELVGGEFVLCHDSASSSIRLYGHYLDPPDPDGEGVPTRSQFVVDVGAEEMGDEEASCGSLFDPTRRTTWTWTWTRERWARTRSRSPSPRRERYDSDHGEEDEQAGMEYEFLEAHTEEDAAERYDSDNGDDDGNGEVGLEYEFYEPLTEEEIAERYDSDNEDDEEEEDLPRPHKISDGETSKRCWDSMAFVAAPAGLIVPNGVSFGPPRFATVKNTAGFMRIAAMEAATTGSKHEGNKEIIVLYRYTRFSRTWSGGRGVEACRRTKLHWLRFTVSPAGDIKTSLAWAGASLSPLIYPGLFCHELRDLWSSLAAPTVTAAIPSRAARLQVVVDVGILRREDHTTERMEYMCSMLENIMDEAWPVYYHVGMELNLPEPVPVRRHEDNTGGDEDGASPPAKRRRIITEEVEECSVCLDPLESGLAAWPGCGHVFHGECVEETLAGRETCPLCRHLLSDELVCYC